MTCAAPPACQAWRATKGVLLSAPLLAQLDRLADESGVTAR